MTSGCSWPSESIQQEETKLKIQNSKLTTAPARPPQGSRALNRRMVQTSQNKTLDELATGS